MFALTCSRLDSIYCGGVKQPALVILMSIRSNVNVNTIKKMATIFVSINLDDKNLSPLTLIINGRTLFLHLGVVPEGKVALVTIRDPTKRPNVITGSSLPDDKMYISIFIKDHRQMWRKFSIISRRKVP